MKQHQEPYILVFGISIYDIFGFTRTNYRAKDSNPGSVKVSFGGVCRNIAENMARVGVNTKFISVVGDDQIGQNIIEHAKQMNFDMSDSLIVEGGATPTYMAILDEEGEMVSAIVDINICHHFTDTFIDTKQDVIMNSKYMFFGADNPSSIEYIVKNFKGQTKFVLDPVSGPKAEEVKHLLPYFHTVKPNRHEAAVMCGFEIKTVEDVRKAGQYFMDQGVTNVFISLDAEGVYYKTEDVEGIIKPHTVDVINVTGAGDSFIAGVGFAYMNNLSIVETVKLAQAMSIITISHHETIHPDMSIEYVQKVVDSIEWDEVTL